MDALGGSRKRAKKTDDGISITDLSSELLVQVTDYLPKTARIFVAVAITAPPSSWRERGWSDGPSPAGRAIVEAAWRTKIATDKMDFEDVCRVESSQLWEIRACGRQPRSKREAMAAKWLNQLCAYYYAEGWSRLDFVDLEMWLCSRLTDDDLGAILMCIDARRNLKQLTLTNCFGLVGQGLQPLRGSEIIETLDLGMNYQFIIPTDVNHRLSAPVVLDVLDSVLETDDNCFQRLQLPRDWMRISTNQANGPTWGCNSAIQAFNARLGGIFHSKTLNTYFGFGDSQALLNHLFNGDDPLNGCAFCDLYDECCVCDHCGFIGCCGCGDQSLQCVHCDINCCNSCAEQIANPVSHCGEYHCESMCRECRIKECSSGYECRECKSLAFDDLLSQISQQQSVIDQLRLENQQLKSGRGD